MRALPPREVSRATGIVYLPVRSVTVAHSPPSWRSRRVHFRDMGHEIVYCFKCAKRLMFADFERGLAVRVNDQVACSDCAPSELANTTPAQQRKSKSGFTTRPPSSVRIPLPSRSRPSTSRTNLGLPTPVRRKKSQLPMMLVGIGGTFVVLIILVVMLLSGGKKKPPQLAQVADDPPTIRDKVPEDPPPPVENAEEKAWRESKEAAEKLRQEANRLVDREQFGAALALWEDARHKHRTPIWNRSVTRGIGEVDRILSNRFQELTSGADLEKLRSLRTRIDGWLVPEKTRALEQLIRDFKIELDLEVTNLVVKSGREYELVPLRLGVDVFTDRDYEYESIPTFLEGAIALKAANDDKHNTKTGFISFQVNVPVILYVAHDARIKNKPGWMSPFRATGEEVGMSERPVALWVREYPAGVIRLGGNGGHRSTNTYMVFILAAGKDR